MRIIIYFFCIDRIDGRCDFKIGIKKTPLPYTVGLFAFGLLIGTFDRIGWLESIPILKSSIDFAGNSDPDMILYIFLPILIFDAAYELDIHVFRKTLTNATILSVPGVAIAMLLTATLMMGIGTFAPSYEGWNWIFALMFGALISATDPVAVIALLKELGTSKRFSTLVDAESMLNDGTGIALFMLFFGAYTTTGVSDSPIADFIMVVAGGALLGTLLAYLCIQFITKVNGDEMLQNSVMILSAYMTFVIAQNYLEVLGVIALVSFGLTVSYMGRSRLKPQVNKFMRQFWELAAHIANTLIFIIVGIVIALKVDFSWIDLLILICVYAGINIIRILIITIFYPIMKRSGYGLSIRESAILSWGGLRGALGLTMALMVSYTFSIPEPIRRQVLFLTAGIVTLTLTINATTIGWLLKKLGLAEIPSSKLLLDYSVKEQLHESSKKYLKDLKQKEALEATDWSIVEQFLPQKEIYPKMPVRTKDIMADIRLRILDRERSLYWSLYTNGVISSGTQRRLNAAIDEQYDRDGKKPLCDRGDIFEFCEEPSWIISMKFFSRFFQKWADIHYQDRIILGYDLARGLIIAQKEALKLVNEFGSSETVSTEYKTCLLLLQVEIRKNITRASNFIEKISIDYPKSYKKAVTRKSVRMLLSNEKKRIEQFKEQGLISWEEAEQMVNDLGERHNKVFTSYHFLK
ncbi:MAG: sodium:proton antiporter [Parabacteroides sp.]|nr:sodium:proton antiporter [Parabacteroides sp.]